MSPEHPIRAEALLFLERLFDRVEAVPLSLRSWPIDHLCYRAPTLERYEVLKREFARIAALLAESQVNGRPIATFKLEQPVRWRRFLIDVIELPAPKPGKAWAEGFEHAEVVCDIPFAELEQLAPRLRFDTSGLSKALNQELELPLGGMALKFHHVSLECVVELEANTGVLDALTRSCALPLLRAHDPLIAGTLPLGLAVDTSPVEVLFRADDRAEAERFLRLTFGDLPGFEVCRMDRAGVPSLVARFVFSDVPFELCAQPVDAVRQTAFRHFQVEALLLKVHGAAFRARVSEQRRSGMSTESAFAGVLGLRGDPLEALLHLHGKTEPELALLRW